MVASDVSSRSSRIRAACASIRPERRSPPRGPGRAFPCSRCKLRHRLTLAGLTPNRAAASRWLAPAATAARTRTRRSTDSAFDMPAGLRSPAGSMNHISGVLGTLSDSVRPDAALVVGTRQLFRRGVLAYPVPNVVRSRHTARTRITAKMTAETKTFRLALIKPSHYDDDGYVIQWFRSSMPSNSLAAVYGLAVDCAARHVLGEDTQLVVD